MTREELTADKKAAVKIVNKLRKQAGMGSTSRLTRGVRRHPRCCTIAMTVAGTGLVAFTGYNFRTSGGKELDWRALDLTPEEWKILGRVAVNFDAGRYPELEIPKTQIKVNGQVIE